MIPTYFGVLMTLAGILTFRMSMTHMLVLVIMTTILGAASALDLPALGGASIQPALFGLIFLAARLASSGMLMSDQMKQSLQASVVFILFVVYGVLSSYLLPRFFYHQVELPPTRLISLEIFSVVPLGPSSQNVTQAVYLVGTLFVLLASTFIAKVERRSRMITRSILFLGIAHIIFGYVDLASAFAGVDALGLLKNSSYEILSQKVGGFYRIAGSFPEASAYSAFGFVILVFATELWLRNVETRLAGFVAIVMTLTLFATTSSSSYIGMGIYGPVLFLRLIYLPSPGAQNKAIVLAGFVLAAIAAVLALMAIEPRVAAAIGDVLADMTVNKVQSTSGIQRGFWVQKSWEAFSVSHGLGVGVGSFRSSSLVAAIAGAMGVFGLATFGVFILQVLPVHRLSTYQLTGDKTASVGRAAAWAAVVGLAPGMVAATNPDPGVLFAIFAGLSFAWLPRGQATSAEIPATG